jgi:osmotically-inducible protein OsmY
MKQRSALAIAMALSIGTITLLGVTACAVQRGQESVGSYVDDATITAKVKAKFIENKQVDASAITVETLKGTVMLSGFAKSATERSTADTLARGVNGVKGMDNQIVVRP